MEPVAEARSFPFEDGVALLLLDCESEAPASLSTRVFVS